jgi:hypothetical protein
LVALCSYLLLICLPSRAGLRVAAVAVTAAVQVPDGEHVWRQLVRLHVDHGNPDVAQQAAARLLE